jgi:hypothetical protein
MTLIRPRLTDHFGIAKPQAELSFAIPFLDEDIPLYVDPFLLWKSPSQQDKALHLSIVNSFNYLGHLIKKKNSDKAIEQLVLLSECDEVGLGVSASRKGKRIGKREAAEIVNIFDRIPHYSQYGVRHFEEIQLFVDGISKDRVSDIACNFLKSFLIDYTYQECEALGLPMEDCQVPHLYDIDTNIVRVNVAVKLPVNPVTNTPILLVPRRWLRFVPWINFEDYFKDYCPRDQVAGDGQGPDRVRVLTYNRDNYGVVDSYIGLKERTASDCQNDPLFSQVPVLSAKRKFNAIKSLPSGNKNGVDSQYEDHIVQLFSSLLYPHLDFAADQSRTDSGVHIRDLVFYNNRSNEFLQDIFRIYGSQQIVMEIKNVKSIEREHINQLNRYMTDSLGKFGILVTRNDLPRARFKDTIDLWSGQRRCIIAVTDADAEQMVEVYESKQREAIDVLKKKFIQFTRACPS